MDAVVQFAQTGGKSFGFIDTGVKVITSVPQIAVLTQSTDYGSANCWGAQ